MAGEIGSSHAPRAYFPRTASTSISNNSVPFGGIPHAGNPPAPYPSCAGMFKFDDFAHSGAETPLIPTCEEGERKDARVAVSRRES